MRQGQIMDMFYCNVGCCAVDVLVAVTIAAVETACAVFVVS